MGLTEEQINDYRDQYNELSYCTVLSDFVGSELIKTDIFDYLILNFEATNDDCEVIYNKLLNYTQN